VLVPHGMPAGGPLHLQSGDDDRLAVLDHHIKTVAMRHRRVRDCLVYQHMSDCAPLKQAIATLTLAHRLPQADRLYESPFAAQVSEDHRRGGKRRCGHVRRWLHQHHRVEGRRGRGNPHVPTFCDVCFWKCGAIAYVKDGRLWKVEGNPLDPSATAGCARAAPAASVPISTLTGCARHSSERSSGARSNGRVTWDEALGQVAEKMQRIKAEYGPEAMAFFSHGIGGNFLKHTLKAYGSPNIAAPSLRSAAGRVTSASGSRSART